MSTTFTRAYTYALDPSPEQERALLSHVGASRFAYNHLLASVLANWDANSSPECEDRGDTLRGWT